MNNLTRLFLLVLALGMSVNLIAQKPYIKIENRKGKAVRTYEVGSLIEYKVKGGEWKLDQITYFDAESGYIGVSNELINIRDVEKVRYESSGWVRALKTSFFTAAVGVTLGAILSIINENEDPKILLYGVPFLALGILTPSKWYRVINVQKRYILKIVDLQKGLIDIPKA